jgi:RNA polymerase sigma factor (sigma-70 family)
MATSRLSDVVQHLRKVILLRDGAGLTDGQLLESYLVNREDVAFAALVRRHAPMVWGVCRRILHNHEDAEDAFQAVVHVLVRKAASIVPRDMAANWLYGVAYQTAMKTRAVITKRRVRERQVTAMPEPQVVDDDQWSDLQPLLDQELSRLPDKYRVAIVLCDLEGKTRKEVARQLRLPEGTVASRLARARTMLAKRLSRRGLAITIGALTGLMVQNAAAASVSPLVLATTIKTATLLAAGKTVAAGAVSAKVAALTQGVLKAMLLSKLKVLTTVVLTAGIIVAGVGTTGFVYQLHASGNQAGVVTKPAVPQQPKKAFDLKSKKEKDWKEVEAAVLRLGFDQLKDTHGDLMGKPSDVSKIRDCRMCHGGIDQKDLAEQTAKLEAQIRYLQSQKERLPDLLKFHPADLQQKTLKSVIAELDAELNRKTAALNHLRGKNLLPKTPIQDENLQEKLTRLERELQEERNERELLQLEVWILLKELQRQNVQKKGGE